ncbi:endonuclease/exonuclease/phosphatase family protein [Sphingomonas sp. R647]|uniref:endonuclease/exonuclease/phosphatase family protein n=1 Tax=Sphingomonas sp. R647 TaxID=2875233 RepID=UPI001CD605CB|nr:endonuclease/exonuclease/phosphatase family protein [Sphingomonas sp. R647]MCA1196505.1 endonuclease/exonuclease/phosphatase family protein [Sphingomonas sp. R647]
MPQATEPAPASAPLKITSWNVEHLAERNGEGCRPRTDADYADLRRHADALAADVIALQEVESKAAAERVFDPARYDVVMSARPKGRRGGVCYGKPGQTIGHQAVGFAIRKGIRWTRNDDLSALALGNPDLRWGVDVTIGSRQPVRLLAVHLKSGCNSGRSQSDPDCPVLFDQLPVLERWIDGRAAAGETFLVLGDWNRRIAARGDVFYAEIDDNEPAGADLSIASEGQAAGCKARYREFIDHIVLGSKALTRMLPGSFEEYRYDQPEDRHPSDHCPVSIRIKP